jgi:sentrin-specific protease 7
MRPTQWQSRLGANNAAAGVGVRAALCYPAFRYTADDQQSPCFLKETPLHEMRAFRDNGDKADPYDWLKIAAKARSLVYHPESELVKVTQASDQASSIGSTMFLRLRSNAEALEVVKWAKEGLRIHVTLEKDKYCAPRIASLFDYADGTYFREQLNRMWDRANKEITQARSRQEPRRLSDGASARLPEKAEEFRTTDVARPDNTPTMLKTPLRSQMQLSAERSTPLPSHTGPSFEVAPSGSRFLRTRGVTQPTRRSETPQLPVISRWSEENRDWAKDWKMPLIIERTTVDKEDIPRLDEGQCLNDNLIGYGLQYLFSRFKGKHKDLNKRVYFHNSFFYEKLKAGRGAINYDGVKSWTAKVDLLSYDYIVVPVNEHYHWWVAIICNPGKLDPDLRKPQVKAGPSNEGKADGASSDVEMTDVTEQRPPPSLTSPPTHNPCLVASDIIDLVSDDKNVSTDQASRSRAKQPRKSKPGPRTYNLEDPRIITLDSLGSTHPQAIGHLKKYLLAEFEHKRNKVITDPPLQLGMTATNIPQQDNLCDCGVYLLGYIKEFVEQPDLFIQTLLQKRRPDWNFDPSHLRQLWRDTIFGEHREYQKNPRASSAKRTPKGSAEPSRAPSQETSEATNKSPGNRGSNIVPTEQPASTEASGTPARPDIHGVDATAADPASIDAAADGKEQAQPSSSGSARSPQPQLSEQNNHENALAVIPPQDNDRALPSIESPDVEELPGRPAEYQSEPRFISPLASSSTSRPEDEEDAVKEVGPTAFYGSNTVSAKARPNRSVFSSPAAGQRRRTANTRPTTTHTSSHFIVAGSSSPELEPVVEKAEMMRHSDAIDLT